MRSQGVTFDTAVLVALERRKHSAWAVYRRARERNAPITIPTPVLGEWWRGRTGLREAICQSATVEPLTDRIARLAGEALAVIEGYSDDSDALGMASAALRGDVVYTGDVSDSEKLRAFFRAVRVLAILSYGALPWNWSGSVSLEVS